MQDYPLAPLEDDCKLLGALLDDCLKIEVGDELFKKVRHTCLVKVPWLLPIGVSLQQRLNKPAYIPCAHQSVLASQPP